MNKNNLNTRNQHYDLDGIPLNNPDKFFTTK